MSLLTKAVRGTLDLLPSVSHKTQYIENTLLEIAENFGFSEIRTPVFEHTELFKRSAGETSDVVQKEMYTFTDRGERSITLKPEGTAGVVRAFLEHGLFNDALPQKMSYITPCYRYDKPQAGRYREHHQFGIECFGAAGAAAEAEIISLANEVFTYLGLVNISLEINSIGCKECRAEYNKALREYLDKNAEKLCETCLSRLEKNPMRILDCKSSVCSAIAAEAPKILDYICGDCSEHFLTLQKYLDAMGIEYSLNPRIVRGLDYYSRTVFEFVTGDLGAQSTVCGGGRYDGLIEELGGAAMPACGFGMGIERLLLLIEKQGCELPEKDRCELYIVSADRDASYMAAKIALEMRNFGTICLFDICERSVKAQMKYAGKINARYTMVLGGDELAKNEAIVKNMDSGSQRTLSLNDFTDNFMRLVLDNSVDDFNFGNLNLQQKNEASSFLTLLQGGKSEDE